MRWLAVLRVGVGLLFLEQGLQKLFGLLGGMGAPGAHVPLGSLMGVAGVVEVVGGILVALGALTRPAAVVLALEMASALVMVHLRRGGWPIQNGGELPLLYLLVFVFLAANGAGPVSLDALLDRRLGHARDTPPARKSRARAA